MARDDFWQTVYDFRNGEWFCNGDLYGMLTDDWHRCLVETRGDADGKYNFKATRSDVKEHVNAWKKLTEAKNYPIKNMDRESTRVFMGGKVYSNDRYKFCFGTLDSTPHDYLCSKYGDEYEVRTTASELKKQVEKWVRDGKPGYVTGEDEVDRWVRSNVYFWSDYYPCEFVGEDSINNGEKENMNNLYEVYVIFVPDQEVAYQDSVLAKSEEQAKMIVLSDALETRVVDGGKLTEYQFICVRVADCVRAPGKE